MKRMQTPGLVLVCIMITAFGGAQSSSPAATNHEPKGATVDPCALLTSSDIRQVQGEAVQSSRRSEQPAGGFRILHCLYTTPTFAKSVSVALAVGDAADPAAPRKYWQQHFHAENRAGEKKVNDDDERPPVEIDGVGEQAYWAGTRIAGALYVLSGDRFLRVSVGGNDNQEVRQHKSIELARDVLRVLSARVSARSR